MGGTQAESKGPDLSEGVAEAALPDGGLLLGHVGDDNVVLARRGQEVFAVGATCTHYGGPLAEGLMVDDTVRCPWHHACFSLRSGEAVGAPALAPLQCYGVERQAGRLRITGKQPAPPPPTAPAGAPARIVIVGAGAAGNACAEALRRHGYAGQVVLLGADPDPPYDRPNLSKDYLAGNAPEEWIPLRPADFYEKQRIQLRTGARVTRIDTDARTVLLDDTEAVPFDRLLLATGADPVRLDLPGADRPHVHTLRTLADSRALIAAAGGAKHALILGASFIGLETAASLRARGLEVHVVAPEARPLERVLGPELGDFIRGLHEQHGVVFRLGQTAQAIEGERVLLQSGEAIPSDLVVMGVGVRPAVALAAQAGLAVDQGVLVDATLETSVPGIYAAGDIARFPDTRSGERVRIEHWVLAERQGQLAARNLLGHKERWAGAPFFWSVHYDVTISYVGHASRWDRVDRSGSLEARSATLAYRRGGRILAVATVGRDDVSLLAERALERDDDQALEALCRR